MKLENARFWLRATPAAGHAEAEPVLRAALAACSDAREDLKRGRRKRLFEFYHDGETYLVKVNDYPPGVRTWLRRSKAWREWTRAGAVAGRGIETPALFAAGEERTVSGRLRRCFTIVRRLPGARDLGAHWRDGERSHAERVHLARALGALVARMHRAGVDQGDLAPNNFLVVPASGPSAEPGLLPIDFERASLLPSVTAAQRTRALAKLHRYLFDTPRALWWRFLLAYSGGDRKAARAAAQAVATELPALFSRDRRHLRRVVQRRNRRFRVLPARNGWAHRDLSNHDVERVLGEGESASCSDTRYWRTPLAIATRNDALTWWAEALALAQRGGLMARPLALVLGADPASERGVWICISERSEGEWVAGTTSLAPGSREVLVRGVCALGLGAPRNGEILGSPDAPGARLRVPPGSVLES